MHEEVLAVRNEKKKKEREEIATNELRPFLFPVRLVTRETITNSIFARVS